MLLKAAEQLKEKGYKLGGMISREIREKDNRVGFEIQDCATGKKGRLAHIHQLNGPKMGRYRVNLIDLNTIGVKAIVDAIRDADIVLIDEIGPMELFSKDFIDAVQKAANNPKPILGTIHYRARHPLVRQMKARDDVKVFELTLENRNQLPVTIVDRIVKR